MRISIIDRYIKVAAVFFLIWLLVAIAAASSAFAATYRVYGCTSLTGGGTGALDGIPHASLNDGDIAICVMNQDDGTYPLERYTYKLDADSGAGESAPDTIVPDGQATKVWLLTAIGGGTSVLGDFTVSGTNQRFLTDGNNFIAGDTLAGFVIESEAQRNTLIGTNGGAKELTTGDANTCIGDLSCENLKTGSFNINMAGYSGSDIESGDGNTQVGGHSGLGGDVTDSFNSVYGFEAGSGAWSYGFNYYDGFYNTHIGANTGVHADETEAGGSHSTLNYTTALGTGASFGGQGNRWVKVTSIADDATGVLVTTTVDHDLTVGDQIQFHGYRATEIVDRFDDDDSCALASYSVNSLRVETTPASNTFTLEWCRTDHPTASTSNWIDGVHQCTGWTELDWDDLFTQGSRDIVMNDTACVPTVAGEVVVAESSDGIKTIDHATVIGAHATADCDDCVVLGREGDNIYFSGQKALISWDAINGMGIEVPAGGGGSSWDLSIFIASGSPFLQVDSSAKIVMGGAALGNGRVPSAGSINIQNEIVVRPDPSPNDTNFEIDDSGDGSAAAGTILTRGSASAVDCQDSNGGCTLALEESTEVPVHGQLLYIVIVGQTSGATTMTESAGVYEMAGTPYAMQLWDSITFMYMVDRWVETARSDN